jgi:hypothetical protein
LRPQIVSIHLNAKADAIAFLQATATRAEVGDEVGQYQVTYDPRSVECVPLKYGANIRALDDPATTPEAQVVRLRKNAHGFESVGLRIFTWHNPHPDRTINDITFTTLHPYASPILFGMTILNNAEAK